LENDWRTIGKSGRLTGAHAWKGPVGLKQWTHVIDRITEQVKRAVRTHAIAQWPNLKILPSETRHVLMNLFRTYMYTVNTQYSFYLIVSMYNSSCFVTFKALYHMKLKVFLLMTYVVYCFKVS
jgi:hypothetical protein